MGQAEWMLIVTIGSLVGVAALGVNLAAAVWQARAPGPVPLTTWFTILVLSASVLWARWEEDEAGTLVAAVATAQPLCLSGSAPLLVDSHAGVVQVSSSSNDAHCHIWALIEDPRTGILWLQGPARTEGATWSLDLSLASHEGTNERLPYRMSIVAVDEEAHEAWLSQARQLDGLVSVPGATAAGWIARDLPL